MRFDLGKSLRTPVTNMVVAKSRSRCHIYLLIRMVHYDAIL